MNTTNKEIKEKEELLLSFKQEIEGLRDISDVEEYAKQLAHLFLGNGLSLQTVLLMAIDFGQQHPNWFSVEDELPKEQGKYMFRLSNGDMYYETYYPKLKLVANVTHWMPIVPPRKED